MVGLTPSTPISKLPMQTINQSLRLILTQTRSGGDTYGSRSLNITTVKKPNNTFHRVRQQKRQMVGRMSQVSNEGDAYRAGSKGIFKRRLIRTSTATVKDPSSKYLTRMYSRRGWEWEFGRQSTMRRRCFNTCILPLSSPSSLSKFLS